MLAFENPFSEIAMTEQDVRNATLLLCQAELIRVAEQTRLDLGRGSYDHFSYIVQRAIDNPEIIMPPSELIAHTQLFALRGAQATLESGEISFHEWTWDSICPLWPFC